MRGWFLTAPRFGARAELSHFFDRAWTPICVEGAGREPAGLVSMLADDLAPRCAACAALCACPGEAA